MSIGYSHAFAMNRVLLGAEVCASLVFELACYRSDCVCV